ncbi:hypothetical protein HMPREF3032_00005, partial [Veillonella sp. DNF00869]
MLFIDKIQCRKSAIVELVFLAPLFDKIPQTTEEHDIFRSKP